MFSLLSPTFCESEREKICSSIERFLSLDEIIRSFPFYEVIDCLYEKRKISKYDLMFNTTKSGNIRLFKELVNKGFPWDSRMMNCSCYYGYIEMLDYLHQKGASFDFSNVLCAVKGKQIYCLSYLFSKGTSFPDIAVETAIKNDCNDVLLFLLDLHRIQPSEKWMRKAIYYQKIDIFKELYNKNPIKSLELYVYSFKRSQKEIKEHILETHQLTDMDFVHQCMRMEEKHYEEEIEKLEETERRPIAHLKKLEESLMEDEFHELYYVKRQLSKKSIQRSKKIMNEEINQEFNDLYQEENTLTKKKILKSKKIYEDEIGKDFEDIHKSRLRLESIVEKTYPIVRCREIEKLLI